MKSMNVRKVGSILAGTAVLGAALSAPVMASMDNTGITKGFFYDANYNPVAQIVVGEKGMASDAVAAGNIAATIGNLAYMTKSVTPSGSTATAEGQVVITTAARGAVGDFVQDTNAGDQTLEDFYEADEGFTFSTDDEIKTYEQGDFTSYTLSCDSQTRNEAGILMTGSYKNVHCLFCHNLCLESLENPAHDMKEQITVNVADVTYYEDGLESEDSEALMMAIAKDAITYTVSTDFIPMETIASSDDPEDDDYLDFEYRGKMILFGEEYYVKDIDGESKIYLAKGKVLDDVTSEGFTAEYNGYKFKVDHLIYAAEYQVAGILLDVQKPDGTIVQTQISKMANGVVDNLEVAGVYAEEAAALQTASLIVYDLDTQVLLEDDEDLQLGGKTYDDWEVTINHVDLCSDDSDCDHSEYDDMVEANLLKNVTITYTAALDDEDALEKDESLSFPNKFKLTFKGYLDNDFAEVPCSGAGDNNILIEKGSEAYQIVMSFTGDDGNAYTGVRLDNGPFARNDLFIAGGELYQYKSYTIDDEDDTVDVELKPMIRGSTLELENMVKFCDADFADMTTITNASCGDDVEFRELALLYALDDEGEYDQDEDFTVELDDVWVKEGVTSFGGVNDVLFVDGKLIITDANFADNTTNADFTYLAVKGDLVGEFEDFDVDGYELDMSIDTVNDTAANDFLGYNSTLVFETADGDVSVDMYDRDTVAEDDDDVLNGIFLGEIELDDDEDSVLIVPEGGDTFTIEWGSNNEIDAVEICHPIDDVDATYFIGTSEEETVAESTITKADEGKEITAGCCTFTVSKFEVSVSGDSTGTVTTSTVNPIVGSVVVPESAADATKNLIIVGGPAVNAMTTVTADDISAQTDKYIVKKDGNKLIVAGWTADDTVAAGNSLIAWLKANAH